MKTIHLAMIGGLLASAACSKPAKEEPGADAPRGMTMDSSRMDGMSGMGQSSMMPMMQAQVDSMMRMSPEQMSTMMAGHERMMSQMMDQMGGQMRQMKMSETPEWSALTDSVKQDMAALPGLKGRALSTRMRAHAGRVRRLMAMHQQRMKPTR
jgi:hypothetical protein